MSGGKLHGTASHFDSAGAFRSNGRLSSGISSAYLISVHERNFQIIALRSATRMPAAQSVPSCTIAEGMTIIHCISDRPTIRLVGFRHSFMLDNFKTNCIFGVGNKGSCSWICYHKFHQQLRSLSAWILFINVPLLQWNKRANKMTMPRFMILSIDSCLLTGTSCSFVPRKIAVGVSRKLETWGFFYSNGLLYCKWELLHLTHMQNHLSACEHEWYLLKNNFWP